MLVHWQERIGGMITKFADNKVGKLSIPLNRMLCIPNCRCCLFLKEKWLQLFFLHCAMFLKTYLGENNQIFHVHAITCRF